MTTRRTSTVRGRARFAAGLLSLLALSGVAVGWSVGSASADNDRSGEASQRDEPADKKRYSVALFGDMPYGPDGRAEYAALIEDVNDSGVSFSVFDGDTKNGSERCDDAHYATTASLFGQFDQGVVYTPGDNEWTDCDRANNGSFDPDERLALIRRTFHATDRSLGQRAFQVTRQAAPYVENQRWTVGPVTYVALHVVGSNNNNAKALAESPVTGVAAAQQEYAARNAANLRWLAESFAAARAAGSKAIMIVQQADMDFEGRLPAASTDGFVDTRAELLRQTVAFPGQVVLVNGDSHFLKIDKPLLDANRNMVENFTRVQTFGDAETHWVEAFVDDKDPNVFSFRPRIVAANVETR